MDMYEKYLHETPWMNLMHTYGRATDFPKQIESFLNGDKTIFIQIRNNIEHQSTIWQASPFMLRVLLELLNNPKAGLAQLLNIFESVEYAITDFLSYYDGKQTIFLLDEMLSPDKLLPDFVDEDEDETVIENSIAMMEDNWHNYYYFCLQLFRKYLPTLKELELSTDDTISKFAIKLCTAIEQIKK